MNTLIFLSGAGIGALITSLLVIAFLGYTARRVSLNSDQQEKMQKRHEELVAMNVELIALHVERNRILSDMRTFNLEQRRKQP